jgi:hypothetical protein
MANLTWQLSVPNAGHERTIQILLYNDPFHTSLYEIWTVTVVPYHW